MCTIVIACADTPASVHRFDDGDLNVRWGGYEIDVPADAVELQGFESVHPPDDDHEDMVAADATVLTVGRWVDGEIGHDGDVDLFVFRGTPGNNYEYFVYSRHDIEDTISGDAVGRTWLEIYLHESEFLCHSGYTNVARDHYDGWCGTRRAWQPFYWGQYNNQRTTDGMYIRVLGWPDQPTGRYSLLVLEKE